MTFKLDEQYVNAYMMARSICALASDLTALSGNRQVAVRIGVAQNLNTPKYVLRNMVARDSSESVRMAALGNPVYYAISTLTEEIEMLEDELGL